MSKETRILTTDANKYIETIEELRQVNTDLEFLESVYKEEINILILHFNPGLDVTSEKVYLNSVKNEVVEEIKRILYRRQLHLQTLRNQLTDRGGK